MRGLRLRARPCVVCGSRASGARVFTRAAHDLADEAPARQRPTKRPWGHKNRAASLMEELFPHESRTQYDNITPDGSGPGREIPRHRYGVDDSSATKQHKGLNEDAPETGAARPLGTGSLNDFKMTKDVAVLHLRKASLHLSEEDFRRVQPPSKHLQGWTSDDHGQVLKVIRSRDPSLARTGKYFIIFSSLDSAKRYLDHITHLHNTARENMTKPLIARSPAVLPGQDDPVAAYALLSPALDIANCARILRQPFNAYVKAIIEQGGYKRLLEHTRSPYDVLMHVDGFEPSRTAVQRAISKDGKLRNMHWELNGMVHRFVFDGSGFGKQYATPAPDQSGDEATAGMRGFEKRRRLVRDVVSFKSKETARRFVFAWHRRDITNLLDEMPSGAGPPIVNAELAW